MKWSNCHYRRVETLVRDRQRDIFEPSRLLFEKRRIVREVALFEVSPGKNMYFTQEIECIAVEFVE